VPRLFYFAWWPEIIIGPVGFTFPHLFADFYLPSLRRQNKNIFAVSLPPPPPPAVPSLVFPSFCLIPVDECANAAGTFLSALSSFPNNKLFVFFCFSICPCNALLPYTLSKNPATPIRNFLPPLFVGHDARLFSFLSAFFRASLTPWKGTSFFDNLAFFSYRVLLVIILSPSFFPLSFPSFANIIETRAVYLLKGVPIGPLCSFWTLFPSKAWADPMSPFLPFKHFSSDPIILFSPLFWLFYCFLSFSHLAAS